MKLLLEVLVLLDKELLDIIYNNYTKLAQFRGEVSSDKPAGEIEYFRAKGYFLAARSTGTEIEYVIIDKEIRENYPYLIPNWANKYL